MSASFMCLENGWGEKVTRSLHCKFEHEAQCFIEEMALELLLSSHRVTVSIVMSLPERSFTVNTCLHLCS